MPTEAQVRQSVLSAYKAKGYSNPPEENVQASIDQYFKKSTNNTNFSRGKALYDKYGDEAASGFTDQLAFNLRNHAREFKSGTVGMVGYLAGALGLDNASIIDYSEELRADGQRAMQEEVRNDVQLQALLAWQADDPVTFTGENANFWEWAMIKRGAASALPSIIEMTATSAIGYLTGLGGVALASKLGKGVSASSKALKATKALNATELSSLATAFKVESTVENVALAMTKRGIYDKTSKGLAMAGMTGLEGSSQYNEAMRYLVDEEGMSVDEASDKAGLSAVMYAPIAGALEYLPMGHWAKGLGLWKKGANEGTKIFARSATKLSKKLAEQQLPVRMITGAVKQATMEATTEWTQYMAQVAMDEAFVKGDYDTPEQALEAITARWKESKFNAEARESIYGGFLMGSGMGVFTPTDGIAKEAKDTETLAGQAMAAAEEAMRPEASATTVEAEDILKKASEAESEETFTSGVTPETEEERGQRIAEEKATQAAEAIEGEQQPDVPDVGDTQRPGKKKASNARGEAASYKSQILKNPNTTAEEKEEAEKAWELGKGDNSKWGQISEDLGFMAGKIRERGKDVKDENAELTPAEQEKLIELIADPEMKSVDRSAMMLEPKEQRKLMADLDSPIFEKEKPAEQAGYELDRKITIKAMRKVAEDNKIDIPTTLKLKKDIADHIDSELKKLSEKPKVSDKKIKPSEIERLTSIVENGKLREKEMSNIEWVQFDKAKKRLKVLTKKSTKPIKHEVTIDKSPELSKEMSNVLPEQKNLSSAIAKAINKTGKKVSVIYDDTIESYANAVDTGTELIVRINNERLKPDSKERGRVILHEATHLITATEIESWTEDDSRQKNNDDPVSRLADLYDYVLGEMSQEVGYSEYWELRKRRKELKAENKTLNAKDSKRVRELQDTYYGLDNLKEFASEVFTSKDFQARLQGMRVVGETTVWDKFVQIIMDIIGIEADSDVLTEALAAVIEIAGLEVETVATKKPTKKPAKKKPSRGEYKRTTHGGKIAGGLFADLTGEEVSIQKAVEADPKKVDIKGLIDRAKDLNYTKLGIKRYGSVTALADTLRAYYNGTITDVKLQKSMSIYTRNFWNAIDKSLRDTDFSDLIDRNNPINDFADFTAPQEKSDPNDEIPNQNGTEKNIFIGWLGVDMTSKEYATMMEKTKEYNTPSEYTAWLEGWMKKTFKSRVPSERLHLLDKGLSRQVRNVVHSFYQKKHSLVNRWFPGIQDKLSRLYFEVEYVAKKYQEGRYGHERASWISSSEQMPGRTWDLSQNKLNPKYETSNFTEQDKISGLRDDDIRTVHLSASQIVDKRFRGDGSVFHQKRHAGITPELMQELDSDFSERWEFDDFDALLTVIGAKGGGRTQLIMTTVEEKWHGVLTQEQFEEYLDAEIEAGNLTDKHKYEFVKSADTMDGKFRYAQLIGQHEWAKKNRHDRYAMPGYWKGIEDFLNRLRIDLAEGYSIQGMKKAIEGGRINNKLMIIPVETIVRYNGQETTYGKFDGATFSSRRWFDVVQGLIGQKPGVDEFDLSFVKSVFRHRSKDGQDYLGAKHAQFTAPAGMEFVNPETGEVIAKVVMDKVGEKSILVDANNNQFDHISSDNEIKNKAGSFEDYYKLHDLGEDDIKILFTGNNKAKDVSVVPFAATEFMLSHESTDNIKRLIDILSDNYIAQADEYITKLYEFLDGKTVDGKFIPGQQLLVDELKRDILAGETPPEIQLLIGLDPTGALLLHPSSAMELTAYFNNKYLLDTAYKGRRLDGTSTQAYLKPQAGMDINPGEVKFSIGNKPMLLQAQKMYSEAMDISIEDFRAMPEIEMIDLLNAWLEDEGGFYVLGSRQPVNKWTAVRPFKVKGFDRLSRGAEVFHNYDDVMKILEGDWDGDKTYFDAFRKADDELLALYKDVINNDISKIDRQLPLTHFGEKLDKGDKNSFANLEQRLQVAENIMAADGAVGLSVSNAALFKSLAFKNFKLSFKVKGKEDVVYEIQQPTGKDLAANYTFQIPLRISQMKIKEEYDIATQATDKIWNDKAEEVSYAQVKKWDEKTDGKLWLRTTREHAFSLMTQMATDDAKFGLLSKLYNSATTTLKDFIVRDIMFASDIKDKKHLKIIKNVMSQFNALQKRQGRFNGKGMNLEQNIATSMQLSDLYSQATEEEFLSHLNTSFAPTPSKKDVSSVFIEMDNSPTPMEKMMMVVGERQIERIKSSDTNMYSSNPLRFEKDYELFSHYKAVTESWETYQKIIGNTSIKDQTVAVSAMEEISDAFYFILQEYFDETGSVKDNVRIDKNEMFDLFKEEYLPIYESLTDAQKAVANMRFLTGSWMTMTDKRRGREVRTRRIRIEKLLPAKFLHKELMTEYATRRLEILTNIRKAEGMIPIAYPGQRLKESKEIYRSYEKNFKNKGWTFTGIESTLSAINEADEFSDFSDGIEAETGEETSHKEREAYRMTAEVLVNSMVGKVSESDIETARGINKARLRAAKGLNDAIYADIVNVGQLKGWDSEDIQGQLQGWNDMLMRFNHGQKVTPASIMFGERKALGLLKRANTMMQRRNQLMKKAKKSGNMSLWERAVGRPEVVMFMWDRTGIANRIVEKALKVGDSAQQVFNQMYLPVGKQTKLVNDALTKAVSLVEGGITLGNAGVGYMEYEEDGKAGNSYIIKDKRRISGIVEYYILSKTDRDGNTEVMNKWVSSDIIQMTEDEFNSKLIEKISSEFVYEIMSGQSRYISFQRIDSYNTLRKEHKGLYNQIDKLATDKNHPEYRHTFKRGGVTYQYVMVKSGEAKLQTDLTMPEFYGAFIVNMVDASGNYTNFLKGSSLTSNVGDTIVPDVAIPKDGWFRSEMASNIETPSGKTYKSFVKFRPSEESFGVKVNKELFKDEDTFGLWRLVAENRAALFSMFNFTKQKNQKTEAILQKYIDRLRVQLGRRFPKEMDQEQREEAINDYIKENLLSGDIEGRMYIDKDGKIRTGNTGFREVFDNYMPRMYPIDALYEMMDTEHESIQSELNDRKTELLSAKSKRDSGKIKKEIEKLEEDFKHINNIRNYNYDVAEGDAKEINRNIVSRQILAAKKRKPFTRPELARKDSQVLSDYMNATLGVAFNNELVANLVQSLTKMLNAGLNEDVIDYSVNKVKQAVGDAGTRGLFGKDRQVGSYKWVAKMLNKLPFVEQEYNADSARTAILHAGGFVSMRFLGATGALQNNTQIANAYIREGMGTITEAWGYLHGDDESKQLWKERISHTGVENTLSMFEHYMTKDNKVKSTDFFTYPGTIIPGKNMVQWVKLLRLSRKEFANGKGGDFEKLDDFIAKFQDAYPGIKGRSISYIRKALYDLMKTDKVESQDIKLVESRIRNVFGDLAKDKFRAAVTWKLSWWFEKAPGKELFTFTEGEKNMRRMVALTAIIGAVKRGLITIPKEYYDKYGDNAFSEYIKTDELYINDEAIDVGRKAVYAMMFGMSEVHLGEAFSGAFKLLNQFRGYPVQQTQFEFDTMRSFFDGSKNKQDSITRLFNAQMAILKQVASGKKNINIYDDYKDHDAVVMLRLMYTRFLASSVSVLIKMIPMAGGLIRRVTPFEFGYSVVRGAESPALSFTLRMAMWGSLAMLGFDDDDDIFEKVSEDGIRSLLMFTTPALLGMLARDVYEFAEWFTEINDNASFTNILKASPLVG